MSTATTPVSYKLHSTFNDVNADVILLCPLYDGGPAKVAFRVQKRHLEAHSSVFQDMFELPNTLNETHESLPVVKLLEVDSTMEVLLSLICNLPEPFIAFETLGWQRALAAWEAAHKYEMYTVRRVIADHLRIRLPKSKSFESVLHLYVRATALGDAGLRQVAFERVIESDIICRCRGYRGHRPCFQAIQEISAADRLRLMCEKVRVESLQLKACQKRIEELIREDEDTTEQMGELSRLTANINRFAALFGSRV